MERCRFIDADSHVLEPDDLWVRYLEPKYRDLAPRTRMGYLERPGEVDREFVMDISVAGVDMPLGLFGTGFVMPNMGEAYDEYAREGFPAKSYLSAMDKVGMDYMVLYPSAGLYTNQVPTLSAELAAAYRRAYNNWLADFCSEGNGRLVGVAGIDLRDPQRAAQEAVRCVEQFGFKAVFINPSPVGPQPLYDPAMDHLWATIAELGVPVGIHVGARNATDPFLNQYFPGLGAAQAVSAFSIGNMIASASFIMGGILERHPKLRIVHLESGAGWVAFWLYRLRAGVQGGSKDLAVPGGLSMDPIDYWNRQCFISADPDDPGIKQVIDAVGDDTIVVGTDFGHPEGRHYGHAIDEILALPDVTDDSKRKMMWDNPQRLYAIG
jgi:predicted TIM-barrel fold metal-dependent hydrolase